MPKVKTSSAAKKRFKLTGTGKIKRQHAYHSHILTKKTKKQKRNLDHSAIVVKNRLFNRMLSSKRVVTTTANIQKEKKLCQDQ